jgi:hypothetical protein
MGPTLNTILVIGVPVLFAALLSRALRALRPQWTNRRVILLSASIMPGLVVIACVYLIIRTLNMPPEKCGIDACAMALMAATFMIFLSMIVFVIGAILSASILRLSKK